VVAPAWRREKIAFPMHFTLDGYILSDAFYLGRIQSAACFVIGLCIALYADMSIWSFRTIIPFPSSLIPNFQFHYSRPAPAGTNENHSKSQPLQILRVGARKTMMSDLYSSSSLPFQCASRTARLN
jgi:hypothetical protein